MEGRGKGREGEREWKMLSYYEYTPFSPKEPAL